MKTVSYKKILREKLDDREQAAEYLTACYEEGPEVFLVGLRDVVEAQGGVARAAELSKLNRESLYRLFSRDGNPRLSSLSSVLSALGLKVTFESGLRHLASRFVKVNKWRTPAMAERPRLRFQPDRQAFGSCPAVSVTFLPCKKTTQRSTSWKYW